MADLAKPKPVPEGYQYERPVRWDISSSAKRAVASARMAELSTPIVRQTMDNVLYDPNAFNVKPEALKAYCSARTEELAQPLKR